MLTNLPENIKKMILMGIGAMATTAEKSKEIIDELVKKGEITVEQGKTLNEELKHSIKSNVDNVKDSVEVAKENITNILHNEKKENPKEDLINQLDSMSKEEIETIKEKLAQLEQDKNAEND